jgi:hypothetical protein
MTKRFFQVFLALAVVALMVCGQQAFASDAHNIQLRVVHKANPTDGVQSEFVTPPAANLYAVTQYEAVTSDYTIWPCFGGASGCSDTDGGSVEIGVPEYGWLLTANTATNPDQLYGCDASTTADAANNCAETETWYEDFTSDTSDDLTLIAEVTQGTSIIYDSGTVDFGPNALGATLADYPLTVVFTNSQNFGTQGVAAGPNNGNCDASFNYPSTVNGYPGEYGIAAKKTCVNPVAGTAKIATTIALETAAWTKSTSVSTCAPVGPPPCYTVKLTSKYKVTLDTTIDLE